MEIRSRLPQALKHGVYSGTTLLPGEDRVAFEKLRRQLVAEYKPDGPSEEDVVETIARLIWRKKNIATYGVARLAREKHSSIFARREQPSIDYPLLIPDPRSAEQIGADRKAAEAEIKDELGEAEELVELGDVLTLEKLNEHLEVIEQIDRMIDRCLKRFLMIKGVKSLSLSLSANGESSNKRVSKKVA